MRYRSLMSDVIGSEFKSSGILNRRERLTLFLGTPLIAAALCFEIVRIWRAFQGGPLLITRLTAPDISVAWTDGPFLFLLGLALHLAIVLLFAAFLFYQFQQARRLVRSKRG